MPGVTNGNVAQVFALLRQLRDATDFEPDVAGLPDWRTEGCIGRMSCREVADELVGLLTLQRHAPFVAGAEVLEDETLVFQANPQDAATESHIRCLAAPGDLIADIDLGYFGTRPDIGVRIAQARLRAGGLSASRTATILETFVDSLQGASLELVRATLEAAALLTCDVNERPYGLAEHPLRTGSSGGAPQVKSVARGSAYRAWINTGGNPWRLHYWRQGVEVSFAELIDHDVFAISAGRTFDPGR